MDLGLAGKVAIITGASEGIGRATAERLAAEGAKVALVARDQDNLDRVAGEIAESTGAQVIGISADVTDEAGVIAAVEQVTSLWQGLDILVNNAGTSSVGSFEDLSNDRLDADFALKVKGAIYCTRAALAWLKMQAEGSSATPPPPEARRPPQALNRLLCRAPPASR